MSRICPVYASYLIRYGTSMEHVRGNSETSISLDVRVLLLAIDSAFGGEGDSDPKRREGHHCDSAVLGGNHRRQVEREDLKQFLKKS
jgi:hypothetical protein